MLNGMTTQMFSNIYLEKCHFDWCHIIMNCRKVRPTIIPYISTYSIKIINKVMKSRTYDMSIKTGDIKKMHLLHS